MALRQFKLLLLAIWVLSAGILVFGAVTHQWIPLAVACLGFISVIAVGHGALRRR